MANRLAAAKQYYDMYANSSNGGYGSPKRISTDVIGGYGSSNKVKTVSQGDSSMQNNSTVVREAISTAKTVGSLATDELAQLFNVALEYLSRIASNTGETNKELGLLNNKDFSSNSQTNIVDNSRQITTKDNQAKEPDRTQYKMAKRIAAGILS